MIWLLGKKLFCSSDPNLHTVQVWSFIWIPVQKAVLVFWIRIRVEINHIRISEKNRLRVLKPGSVSYYEEKPYKAKKPVLIRFFFLSKYANPDQLCISPPNPDSSFGSGAFVLTKIQTGTFVLLKQCYYCSNLV